MIMIMIMTMIKIRIRIMLMLRNEYKWTESHNLRNLQVNIIDKYTGVNFDPTPLRAHTIFRPTKD